ncbi:hypothetical protein M413DRAFT_439511 [Hebeloma cylindrosporum]|uniref:Protein kinase domain-containing protein n=1 Tax=Hebeloma cylindrosporum TaxID=76867 RepID=A0A0C2Z3M7_HEBCY|nr:hypothetical protein M413DRAFT_439511 [Hebeloma cylindrosporum h7]
MSGWLISAPTNPQAQSLVNSLLVQNPLHRATVHSALVSDWICSELDQLDSLYRLRITRTAS